MSIPTKNTFYTWDITLLRSLFAMAVTEVNTFRRISFMYIFLTYIATLYPGNYYMYLKALI